MTTPQQIDGGKSPPCPHHPAVRSDTMTERKRCLAIIDQRIADFQFVIDKKASTDKQRLDATLDMASLTTIRTRIESGEQP